MDKNNDANKISISNYLFSSQELLDYLNNISKKQEVSILLFEIEGLDKFIYLLYAVCKATQNVLHMINIALPQNVKIFQISHSICFIIFVDSNIDKVIELAYVLPKLMARSKNNDNINLLDIALCIGIAKGDTKILYQRLFVC